ncbi:protein SPMIP1 [Carettochelys insculpta]|uniref:protein SPMIP1 n=1 Tax=Carettochelys insculpta TaxID=44489 RepID=UPI003EC0FE12
MRDLLTTRAQQCWKELIEREALSRVSWKMKYGHKFPRLEPCIGSRRKGILPAICLPKQREEGLSSPRTQEEGTGFKKQGEVVNLPRKQEDKGQDPHLMEMRPATPKTKHLLYQGTSQEGKGRHLYLQARKLKSPEEKFHYPVLSSWEYGWHLRDVITEIKTPIHARSGIVKDTFYIRNGVFSHPSKTDKLA